MLRFKKIQTPIVEVRDEQRYVSLTALDEKMTLSGYIAYCNIRYSHYNAMHTSTRKHIHTYAHTYTRARAHASAQSPRSRPNTDPRSRME